MPKNMNDSSKPSVVRPLTEEEQKFYQQTVDQLLSVSPYQQNFFTTKAMYDSLLESLSLNLVRDSLPQISSVFSNSIISAQFDDEPYQWIELFNHFLDTSIDFMFKSGNKSPTYYKNKAKEFVNSLYVPLYRQYQTLLSDIITYNYSPFKVDLKLFKNSK